MSTPSTAALTHDLDNATLATLVAALPDGTDLSSLPFVTQLRLGKDGAPRDPSRVMEIFKAVGHIPGVSLWMRSAAANARVDALRRTRAAVVAPLMQEAEDIMRGITAAQSTGPAERLLAGDVCYNIGLLLRMKREYAAAALAQQRSALWYSAAGKPDKVAVSLFVAAVENLSAAFVARDKSSIRVGLAQLHTLRTMVKQTTDPLPTWFTKVGGGNAVLHIAWGEMMAKLWGVTTVYPDHIGDRVEIADMRPPQGSPPNHWVTLFDVYATLDLVKTQPEKAEQYAQDVVDQVTENLKRLAEMDSSSIANVLLSLRLLRAKAYDHLSDRKLMQQDLLAVVSWNGHDGGVPMAVAGEWVSNLQD